jgi:hypothetical protein
LEAGATQSGTLLLVSHGNDLEYLNIVLNVFETQKAFYREVKFLDLSSVLEDQDTFYRPLLKSAGLTSPEETIFDHLKSLGYDVYRIKKGTEPESIESIPTHVKAGIEESIKSASISRSGDEMPEDSNWLKKKQETYRTEGIVSYLAVKACLSQNPEISHIAVINGRFPCQRGVIEAAVEADIPWSSYERGSYDLDLPPYLYSLERYLKAVNYWYAPYPAYTRIEKQEAILAMDLRPEQIHSEEVEKWFLSRRHPGGTNKFAAEWNNTPKIDSSKKMAVLFTSSVDEFAELGPSWKEAKWKDQWEAFEYVIPRLLSQNYHVVLRVHPNLSNKPSETGRITRQAIDALVGKFPEMELIEPTAKTNSYALLDKADLAIVWISTIGLEASHMGVRTICLSSSEYDLVADVKRWLSEEDIDFSVLDNWTVDNTGSLKFIAGMFAHDHPARQLLPEYGVDPYKFGKGVALFANKWAMRNTNNITNLVSIILPSRIFLFLRKIYRRIKFSKLAKGK